ncbi:MAG: zinc ribbon domain-containing protein, partial [Acidimicrobiia bacterium]
MQPGTSTADDEGERVAVTTEGTSLSAASLPPLPQPGPLTAFFWEAIDEGRLDILRCNACGHHVHYPRPI